MNDDFPDRLRRIRVLKNYSQEYVAEQIGVSLSTYARYELGKIDIGFNSIKQLASLYNLSIDELLHFGDPNYQQGDPVPVKRFKVVVSVELDGDKDNLNKWINKLSQINELL